MAPPRTAATTAVRFRSCGTSNARNSAGNAASRPSASGSPRRRSPATAPTTVEVTHDVQQHPRADQHPRSVPSPRARHHPGLVHDHLRFQGLRSRPPFRYGATESPIGAYRAFRIAATDAAMAASRPAPRPPRTARTRRTSLPTSRSGPARPCPPLGPARRRRGRTRTPRRRGAAARPLRGTSTSREGVRAVLAAELAGGAGGAVAGPQRGHRRHGAMVSPQRIGSVVVPGSSQVVAPTSGRGSWIESRYIGSSWPATNPCGYASARPTTMPARMSSGRSPPSFATPRHRGPSPTPRSPRACGRTRPGPAGSIAATG